MRCVLLVKKFVRRYAGVCARCLSSATVIPPYVTPSLRGAYTELLHLDEYRLAQTLLTAGQYKSADRSLHRAQEIIQNSRDETLQTLIQTTRAHSALHDAATHDEIRLRRALLTRLTAARTDTTLLHAQLTSLILAYVRAGNTAAALAAPTELAINDTPTVMILKAVAVAADAHARAHADVHEHIAGALAAMQNAHDGDDDGYGDRAVTAADAHLIAGAYSQLILCDESAAAEAYERAIAADERETVSALAVSGRVSPVVSATINIADAAHANRAVELCERFCGADHWTFADILTRAANVFADSDAVIAEGLYRSAIARAEREMSNSTMMPANSFISVDIYTRAITSYAALLDRTEWNGKSRKPEADALRAKAQTKLAPFAARTKLTPIMQHLLTFLVRFTG